MTVYSVTNTDTSAAENGTLAYAFAHVVDGDTISFTVSGNFQLINSVYLPKGTVNISSALSNNSDGIFVYGGALYDSQNGVSSLTVNSQNFFNLALPIFYSGQTSLGGLVDILEDDQSIGALNVSGGTYISGSVANASTVSVSGGLSIFQNGFLKAASLIISGPNNALVNSQGRLDVTNIVNNDTLDVSGTTTFGDLSNVGTVNLSADVTGNSFENGNQATISSNVKISSITNNGTLNISSALSDDSTNLINSGNIDLGGTTATIGSLTMSNGVIKNGSISVTTASLQAGTIPANLTASQTVTVSGGVTLSGTNSFASTIGLASGSLELSSQQAAGSASINFGSGSKALLQVDSIALGSDYLHTFRNTISGFTTGDFIDVNGLGVLSTSFNYSTDVLTLSSNGTVQATLQLAGSYTGETFVSTSDNRGGSSISLKAVTPSVTIGAVTGSTAQTSHVVSGTVDPTDVGTLVSVMNGNTALGTATADANGNWSLPFVYTGDGSSYTYNLTATDTNATGTGTSSATSLALNFAPNQSSFGTVSHDTNHPGGEIYALYEGLLGRAPDAQGAEGWVASLNSGTTVAQVAQAFLNSPEGQQTFPSSGSNKSFVDTLYQKVLGRTADTGGEQGWVNNLNAGDSRAEVADAFVFSNEHVSQLQPALNAGIFVADANTSMVARLYYGLLGRAPDAGGLAGNTQAVNGGASIQTVAQSFINSNEYQSQYVNLTNDQFVTALYQNALGRSPDQGGLQAWNNQLAAGSSRASVAASIIQSQEGQNHLPGKIETGFHLA